MDRMKAAGGDDAHADGTVSKTSVDPPYDKMARPTGGGVGGLWRRQLMAVELVSTAFGEVLKSCPQFLQPQHSILKDTIARQVLTSNYIPTWRASYVWSSVLRLGQKGFVWRGGYKLWRMHFLSLSGGAIKRNKSSQVK